MGLNLGNQLELYEGMRAHVGHEIVCVLYGEGENVAIECETCGEVLVDANDPDSETAT